MSSLPSLTASAKLASVHEDSGQDVVPKQRARRWEPALLASLLGVAGLFAIYSTGSALWALWTTDPLKSIGGIIPLVSLLLIARVWRSLNWETDGTWWGLALVTLTVASVHLRDHAILELILTPSWTIFLPPHSLVAFCYTAGLVLLFGGMRLFRAALFPVVLTWFVNPVPNTFNRFIDLPLQRASALIARSFAHAMGQQLSPDQLKLMFTPDFGMFIAPGCNGIRGAITMGFIALIAGYVYRFRKPVWVATVAGALLLGYVFNFVRLCTLVLYYCVALKIQWLQPRAEMGDYIIGACLFFFATVLLFTLIRRFSANGDLMPPALPRQVVAVRPDARGGFGLRAGALLVVLLVGSVSYARAMMHSGELTHALSDPTEEGRFPKQVGPFTLRRTWSERLQSNGALIFYWADYQADPKVGGAAVAGTEGPNGQSDGPPVVSVGISPVLGAHDTLICHSARGDDWLWHGDVAFATAAQATSFSTSLFADGATQYVEATTVCTGETCGQYSTARKHLGFVYSRPDTRTLLTQSPSRPIPVLLRTETLNQGLNADAARSLLTANLRLFLGSATLADFTRPYRTP
jgi:exosortase J